MHGRICPKSVTHFVDSYSSPLLYSHCHTFFTNALCELFTPAELVGDNLEPFLVIASHSSLYYDSKTLIAREVAIFHTLQKYWMHVLHERMCEWITGV